ncbi:MAG TPA: TIGR03086 family metal-binding protein [Jatrophihabitans sp.]|nr:TIGR03086 family metal-binding protein [Jatrophihabitans sp.]
MSDRFQTLLDHDRVAVLATVDLVETVQPEDLARPTPCGSWTLADLIAHMTGQQLGFAAAAAGAGTDLAEWVAVRSSEPVQGYRQSCTEVLTAFAGNGVAERDFALPEIRDGRGFPAPQAISFHLVDNVVHAWDVAASLGADLRLSAELIDSALRIARQVPDGPERLEPGAAFAPGLAGDGADEPLQTVLRLLGRDPHWQPS